MQVAVNSLSTHYQQLGNRHQPNMVLLHGWGCDWQIWSPIVTELSTRFSLLIPDLPAFGKTANPDTVWDSTQYVQWLHDLLEYIDPHQPWIVVGHSFGGKIASIFAQKHANKTSKLIVIDASGLPDPLSFKQTIIQNIASVVPSQLKQVLNQTLKKKILDSMEVASDHLQSNQYQRQVLQKIVREDISNFLSGISSPSLVIWGENDTDTPLHQGKRFAEHIPDSQLVLFPTGHYPFIEQPQQVTRAIIEFASPK